MEPQSSPHNRASDTDSAFPSEAGHSDPSDHSLRVALIGNPNTGKSTLFNQLTGVHQQTANYPRVTYEHHVGKFLIDQQKVELIDLPGTYSLTPRSPEELIPLRILLEPTEGKLAVDVILCLVDGSNLDRNLFLVSQILELQRPTVLAVNMLDVAEQQGKVIQLEQLGRLLGVPVVGIQANRGLGLDQLKKTLLAGREQAPATSHNPFPEALDQSLTAIARELQGLGGSPPSSCRFLATRLLFDTENQLGGLIPKHDLGGASEALKTACQACLSDGLTPAQLESECRYRWIQKNLPQLVQTSPRFSQQGFFSQRLDRWLTDPFWGLLVALLVLVLLFQSIFWIAEPASALIDELKGICCRMVDAVLPEGALRSLINDGLISGVGGVLVFLPQIVLLFLILAILEDTGYLARAAYLMDRLMARVGLSGISLFPLLSSFACAIPGIMSTRVIPNRQDRMITILVAPLMSCSARLPVYVLMIAAFVPDHKYLGGWLGLPGLVMLAMYLIGILVAIGVAWILRKTLFRGGTSTFVMELPTYKIPSLRNIFQRMLDGGWAFVRDAGTVIVAVTVLVWAASYFPRAGEDLPLQWLAEQQALQTAIDHLPEDADEATLQDLERQLEGVTAAYQLRQSYLGRAGRLIEPLVIPLGWDWRIGSAAIASFPAREVVVATLGVIFSQGSDVDEESPSLRTALENATWEGSDRKLFNLPVAFSLMVFFALCAQCASTLAVIKRETGSWWWPIFTFAYMTALAYLASLTIYQLSNWLTG
jgi:ferrous iron transport protein B